jgi:hypothetical protein
LKPISNTTGSRPDAADNGFGRDQDKGIFPSGPESLQDNPEQIVQGSQSTARPFGVQRQDLLAESEIFKDEVLSGTESADNPSQEMSERYDFGQKSWPESYRNTPHQARFQVIHSASARGFDEGQHWVWFSDQWYGFR